MSILIKGMEMPPDCRVCPFETYYMNTGKTRCGAAKRTLAENFKTIPFVGRADFCPLIELPPHGDLIDRDALMKTCGMAIDCYDCPNGEHGWCKLSSDATNICEAIEDAPTIIESEEEDG